MDMNLMLELITHGASLDSNLAPLLHENGKLWPYQKSFFAVPPRSGFFPAHERLANAAPGIDLRDVPSDFSVGQSVSLATLAHVLNSSLVSADELAFDKAVTRGIAWRTFVLAWLIHGLACGSYLYWPTSQRLIPVRRLSDERFEERVALDGTDLKGTTAIIALCGFVGYDGVELGERHYRNLLLLAGSAADRVVVSARKLGIEAGIVAGFLDDALSSQLGIDPNYEQPLVAIALKGAISDGI